MGWSNSTFQLLIVTSSPSGFSGLFVYSPAPGTGNLVDSIAATSGTDPYGNAYQAGITSYGSGITHPFGQLSAGALTFKDSSRTWALQLSSGFTNQMVITDTVNNLQLFIRQAGNTAQVVGNDPNNLGSAETWHDSTSLLNAGWAANDAGGTIATMKYTLSAADSKVFLQGTLHQTSATPSATLLTLPAAYRPAAAQFVPVTNFNGATATASIVQVNTTGDVNAPLPLPGNGNDVTFDCFYRLVA